MFESEKQSSCRTCALISDLIDWREQKQVRYSVRYWKSSSWSLCCRHRKSIKDWTHLLFVYEIACDLSRFPCLETNHNHHYHRRQSDTSEISFRNNEDKKEDHYKHSMSCHECEDFIFAWDSSIMETFFSWKSNWMTNWMYRIFRNRKETDRKNRSFYLIWIDDVVFFLSIHLITKSGQNA